MTIKSEPINTKKVLRIGWGIIVGMLVVIIAIICLNFSKYKEAQEIVVQALLEADPYFEDREDDYENNYAELVKDMYYYVDNHNDLDHGMGESLNEAGYDCYAASWYLIYTNVFSYSKTSSMIRTEAIRDGLYRARIIWSVAAILLLITSIYCYSNRISTIEISGDNIVCRKKGKVIKEFLIKDIKSVSINKMCGIKIQGNGIKYSVSLVKNRNQLKSAIMDHLASQQQTTTPQSSNADELKKYKDLLDSGVISQEEFDTKKKQLLDL